jgi:hypothetical protein
MSSEQRYAVFLSHNSKDKSSVEWLAEQLSHRGLTPFLDKWDLHAGDTFRRELESALASCDTAVVFFGRHGQGDWQAAEIDILVERALRERSDFRIAPALLEGADDAHVNSFLKRYGWIDFRHGLDDAQTLEQLIAFVEGRPFRSTGDHIPDDAAPYRGLERFEAENADIFFGRDDDIRRLATKLVRTPFLAVIGPSGSGKSSLVRAGLCSPVAQSVFGKSRRPQMITVRPGAHPLRALADGIRVAADALGTPRQPADPLTWSEAEIARMCADTGALSARLSSQFAAFAGPVILVIDQFEELFTHATSTQQQADGTPGVVDVVEVLVANLVAVARDAGDRLRVLIAVRADFLGRCLELPALQNLMQDRLFLLGELDGDGLRAAIRLPAERCGAFFERGLVELIVNDVAGQRGSLPLLELALKALWRGREGRWLTLDAYRVSGGVSRALRQLADATFEGLRSPQHQDMARNLLLRLTTLGEGVGDTRRRAERVEFYPEGVARAVVDETIAALADKDARLILPHDDGTVEVTHEALIHEWPRLGKWLRTNRDKLRLHRQLTETARAWEDAVSADRKEGYLFRQGRLKDAEDLAAKPDVRLSQRERNFLNASLALRAREERRRVRALRRLQLLSAAAVLAAVFGFGVAVYAERQRGAAAAALSLARYQQSVAAEKADDPNRAMAYLAAAMRADPTDRRPRDRLYWMLIDLPFYLPNGAPTTCEGQASAGAVTTDGHVLLVSSDSAGGTLLRDARTSTCELVPLGLEDGSNRPRMIKGITLSRNGSYLLVLHTDGTLERWRWEGVRARLVDTLNDTAGVAAGDLSTTSAATDDATEGTPTGERGDLAVAEDGTAARIVSERIVLWRSPAGVSEPRSSGTAIDATPTVLWPQAEQGPIASADPRQACPGTGTPDRLSIAADASVLVATFSHPCGGDAAIQVFDLRIGKGWSRSLSHSVDRHLITLTRAGASPVPVWVNSEEDASGEVYSSVLGFPRWDWAADSTDQPAKIADYEADVRGFASYGTPLGDVLVVGPVNGRLSFHSTADDGFRSRIDGGQSSALGHAARPLWGEPETRLSLASPDGDVLVTVTRSRVQAWRRHDGRGLSIPEITSAGLTLSDASINPCKDVCAAEHGPVRAEFHADSQFLRIFDGRSGQLRCSGVHWPGENEGLHSITWLSFDGTGRYLAVGEEIGMDAGKAFLIDVEGCELGAPLIKDGPVLTGARSPDGRLLALVYNGVYSDWSGGPVQVWDIATGTAQTSRIEPNRLDTERFGDRSFFHSVTFESGSDRLRIRGGYVPRTSGDTQSQDQEQKRGFEAIVRVGLPPAPSSGKTSLLADLAEIVSGLRLSTGGEPVPLPERHLALERLREMVAMAAADDPDAEFARRLLASPSFRGASPTEP